MALSGLRRLCDAEWEGAHDAHHLRHLLPEVGLQCLLEQGGDARLVLAERESAERCETPCNKYKSCRDAEIVIETINKATTVTW